MLHKLLNWLRRPYPFLETLEEKMSVSLVVGLAVALFLYIFQPFGIRNVSTLKGLYVVGFGVISTIVGLFFFIILPLLFPRIFSTDRWTIGRQSLFIIIQILVIAFGNWHYNHAVSSALQVPDISLPIYVGITIVVGILPVILTVFFSERVLRRAYIDKAEAVSQKIQTSQKPGQVFALCDESGKGKQEFYSDEFCFAKAEGNYLYVTLVKDSEPQMLFLRSTMRSFEELFHNEESIVRCHRSYMVNLAQVNDIQGNARGYTLNLHSVQEKIPVSRSLSSDIVGRLHTINKKR